MNGGLYLRQMRAIFFNGLLFKNPVLVGALGLFPVVAGCFSLLHAVELSLLFFLIALPASLVLCLVGPRIPAWLRLPAGLCACAVFYPPAMLAVNALFPGAEEALGVFAWLMVGNSLLLSRTNEYAPTHVLRAVLADVAGCSLGYAAVMCTVAVVRELLLTGQIWNRTAILLKAAQTKAAALPFFGFLLLGFLAAVVQAVNHKRSARGKTRRVTRS